MIIPLSSILLIQTFSMVTKMTSCLPIKLVSTRALRFGFRTAATSPDVPSKRRFSAWGEGSDRSSGSSSDSGRSSFQRPPGRNIDGGSYNDDSSNAARPQRQGDSYGNSARGDSRDSSGRGRGGGTFARTTYRRDDAGSSYSRGNTGGSYQGNRDNYNEESREPPCGYFEGDHLYGISPIRMAIASGRRNITELLIQEGMEISSKKDEKSAMEILKIAKEKNIVVREFPKHDLNMLSENRPHQGFILRAAPLQFKRLDSLPVSEKFQCVLALDEVWDPQNFGALLRTSHFLGVDKVVVCAKNSAPLSPTVSKASSGALEIIEVSSTDNMMRFLDKSQENGWQVTVTDCLLTISSLLLSIISKLTILFLISLQVIGTSLGDTAMDLDALPLTAPTILVLGNEGHGVRTNILRRCTHLVKIAGMTGGGSDSQVDSLNVSVTGGILLHHILKAKKQSPQ